MSLTVDFNHCSGIIFIALMWINSDGTKLISSNLDGSDLQTLSTGTLTYPTEVAASGSKTYVLDYGTALYSFNRIKSIPIGGGSTIRPA